MGDIHSICPRGKGETLDGWSLLWPAQSSSIDQTFTCSADDASKKKNSTFALKNERQQFQSSLHRQGCARVSVSDTDNEARDWFWRDCWGRWDVEVSVNALGNRSCSLMVVLS
jgi:hypothetical protein